MGDDQIIVNGHGLVSIEKIAEQLNRDVDSVKKRIKELNL